MKPSVLSLTLLAVLCHSSQSSDQSVLRPSAPKANNAPSSEVDSLKNLITKQYPYLLPSFLVSFERCSIEVAKAFAIGRALGEHCEKQIIKSNTSSSSNADGVGKDSEKEKQCDLLRFVWHGDTVEVRVVMTLLYSAITANLEWVDTSQHQKYNPFTGLFSLQEIQNPEHYKSECTLYKSECPLCLVTVRRFFATHAKSTTAMIVIDVAILRWLVHAINTKSKHTQFITIHREIIMALCALSMHPSIFERCMDDILTMLSNVHQQFKDPDAYSFDEVEYFTPFLITLFKFLNDGPVREKVKEIITDMCSSEVHEYENGRMLLGRDHSLLETLKTDFSEDEIAIYEGIVLAQEREFGRRLHSMSIDLFQNSVEGAFMSLSYHTYLCAQINQNETLNWNEAVSANYKTLFEFRNRRAEQLCLFIFSKYKVPDVCWKQVTCCTSMPKFLEFLGTIEMRRMIFIYGMTILESSSAYKDQ